MQNQRQRINNILVKDKQFYKSLFLIALPVAFQALLSVSVNLLDNLMVSSLSDVALSSVAMANQITVFLSFFMRGIGGASGLMISQYWGKGDKASIRKIYAVVLRFSFVIVIILSAVLFCFPKAVMSIFVNTDELIETSAGYLRIVCISYIFGVLSDATASLLRGVMEVKITLYLTIISLVTNLLFNYLLIFGKFGFPCMGVRGAATATVIARITEFIFAMLYLFIIDKKIHFTIRDLFGKTDGFFRDFLKFGLPALIGDLQWGLVGTVKSIPVGRLGEVMISANSISETVMSLFLAFTTGMASAACVVIGKSIGEMVDTDYSKTKQYSRTIQILFAFCSVILSISMLLLRRIPVSFFTGISEEAREYAIKFMAIGAISIAFSGYHISCFTGINRGAGDTKFVFRTDMICGWLIVVPATFLAGLEFSLPFTAVYFCTRIDQFFKWIIAFIRLNTSDKWIKNITR